MRIPFASSLKSRDGTLDQDAKVVNGIVEPDGEAAPMVRRRPGLVDLGLVRVGAAQLLYYWYNKVRTVIGDYISDVLGIGATLQYSVTDAEATPTGLYAWTAVAHNGTVYCAVAESGGYSMTSTDGATWSAGGAMTDRAWSGIASDGSRFVAIAQNTNYVAVSTDNGATWSEAANMPQSTTWDAICWAEELGKFVAVANSIYTATSSDGVTWAAGGNMPGAYGYLAVTWAPELSLLVAVGNASGSNYATSPTGAIWTGGTFPAGAGVSDIVWNGSLFVVPGYGTAYYSTSPDGTTWTRRDNPASMGNLWRNVAYDSSIGLFLGFPYSIDDYVYSPDGTTWTAAGTVAGNTLTQGAVSNNAGQFVSVSTYNAVYPKVLFRYEASTVLVTDSAALSPTSAGEQFSAQDNGANSPEALLMIKNSTQAWTINTSDTVTQITDVDYPGKYTVTLTSLTRSSTTATATTAADTNFRAGDSVVIAGVNEAGWNGTYTILSTTRSGQTIPAPDPVAVTITRSGTTATATSTAGPHGYTNGQSVTIAGAEQAQYNGTKTIAWISATQFSFAVTVTNAVSAEPTSPATGTPVITPKTYAGLASSTIGSGVVDIQPQGTDQATVSFFAGLTAGVQVTITFCASDAGFVGTHTIASSGTGYSRIAYSGPWQGFTTITVRGLAPAISSITTDGAGTATVTTSGAHGFMTGQRVTITGASPWQYNVTDAIVTVTGTTTFSYRHPYTVASDASPASPATGAITAQGPASVSGASFTFTVDGTETTPATGTITANSGRTTVPGIAYLNGYFVVMDEQGVIYNSAQDDPENWNALEYTSALNEPGAGKAIAKSGNYIAAFKEWSTEFFYDAQNPTESPLSPVDNGFTLVGCANGWSVANVDGSLMWIAQSKKHKGRQVYRMVGTEQEKVSTPDVERVLNADTLATVYAWGARIDGHPCYVLSLVGSDVTIVYDTVSGAWYQWTSLTIGSSKSISSITLDGTTATVTFGAAHGMSDGDPLTIAGAAQSGYNGLHQVRYVSPTVVTVEVAAGTVTPATGTILGYAYTESYLKWSHYAAANGVDVVLHVSDGHLYEIDPAEGLDDGVPVNYFIRTARLDGGATTLKKFGVIRVIGERVSDTAMMRWSDDDCSTFTKYREVDLSAKQPELRRCGSFRRRNFEFRHVGDSLPRVAEIEA